MTLKYQRAIESLTNMFMQKKFVKGDKLPNETELMEFLGVGRNTIRKAILEMEKEGIVKKQQGSGTFFIQHKSNPLKSGGLIGLANFYGMEYIYTDIIKGVENALYDEGYSLVIANSIQDSLRDLSSLKMMLDQDVKGLIFDLSMNFSGEIKKPMIDLVKSADIPVVTTHWNGSLTEFSTVSLNDEHGGYEATKYLISKGHRDIAIIYKDNVQAGRRRFAGYKRALDEAGIKLDSDIIFSYDGRITHQNDADFGLRCTEDLLDSGAKFSAIFYFNDMIAMEGYKVLESRGLRIPEDISVIGFDNYKHSAYLTPPLTTIEHPKEQLGYWAGKLLLSEIKGNTIYQHKSLVFEPVLIERGSVSQLEI